ncbi:MAG: hypothetical protein COU51_03970 [Parcubacteria group bacterium CG10_big_fil_rev_8_21_14_0_10_36_14]|nr:MAG: hypothetical protein COU51_03970 [Parcubacteria group bacterium CG10_big_fil_rev_8_21_14_0_10_36_14]
MEKREENIEHRLLRKKVCLIACPWLFYNEVEFRSQQLGLGYVGAYAEENGHLIIAFIDPMMEGGEAISEEVYNLRQQPIRRFGHSDEWIIGRIPKETDIIGINAPFTDSRLALYPLVKKIKSIFSKITVVVGGVLATTLPREVIEESGADIVVRGEGEIAFTRILNDEPWENIPGLVCRLPDGTIKDTGLRVEQFRDIDKLPFPSYRFRPMEEYVTLSTWGNRVDRTLHLISSRGCPFDCQFCSSPEKGQRFRAFSTERVLKEIRFCIEEFGINRIEIADDNFTFNKKRVLEILDGIAKIREKGHDLKCTFPNGVMLEKMDKEVVFAIARAGVEILYLPVESGDERILVAMNKFNAFQHLDQALQVADWCNEAKLPFSCFLIVGYPGGKIKRSSYRNVPKYEEFYFRDSKGNSYIQGEDERSFEKTLKFLEKFHYMGSKGITPLITTPLPGTELYEFCEKFGYLVFPDSTDTLVTVSYAAVTPEVVQINTPWCSREDLYKRWRILMEAFPTYHNVRKLKLNGDEGILSGTQMKK